MSKLCFYKKNALGKPNHGNLKREVSNIQYNRKVILLLVFLAISILPNMAQVRDVRENVSKDRSSSRSSSWGNAKPSSSRSSYQSDDDNLVWFEMMAFLFRGVGELAYVVADAQRNTVYQRLYRPELVSLQATTKAGIDFRSNAYMINPGIRGNRGLFATEFNWLYVNDITGGMSIIDWQVLIIRIPIRSIKFDYGIGFSYFTDPEYTYFDQSFGFEKTFTGGNINLQGQYKWSNKSNFGPRYREVFSIEGDFYLTNLGRFRLSPFLGYNYQNYFNSTSFNFITLGVKFRLQ
ncbi:hypothetical protein [Alkalitalea saponilacus]|uniref:Uncharacterized protein n=1 Tax=Alkalitalea saponilacus TaxID=889453 RepID=A0A1T5A163_9BACT|nr:hypothetical protein [Alkalitalea saponilacus]ASB48914.1 hypothetical protein CDL62_07075 [Alkalitalea saponilacus]SKB28708.1 hypothetical protein SAMN03080601_00021 [Alkalitalea saponilacus]